MSAGLLALAGCGQKGDLFLPTEPAAQNRATLPQVLDPRRLAVEPQPAAADSPAPTTPPGPAR